MLISKYIVLRLYFQEYLNIQPSRAMYSIHLTYFFLQIEVVKNSTSGKEWTSIDIKWRAPEKHPAGKITIR